MDRICWGGQKAFIYDNAVFGRMEGCIVRIALERARGVSLDKQELEAWYLMYDRQRITGRRSDDGIIFFVLGTRRSPRDGESSQTRVSRQSKTSHISHTLNNFLAPPSPLLHPLGIVIGATKTQKEKQGARDTARPTITSPPPNFPNTMMHHPSHHLPHPQIPHLPSRENLKIVRILDPRPPASARTRLT